MEIPEDVDNIVAQVIALEGDRVRFQPARLARLIAAAVSSAMIGPKLMLSDLTITIVHNQGADPDLSQLMAGGTKLLDACIWLSLGRPAARPPVRQEPGWVQPVLDMATITASLAAQIMFIMIRGACSRSATGVEGVDVPSIIHQQFPGIGTPLIMCQRIASFDLSKLGTGWVSAFPWVGVSEVLKSRLALGVAGYRYLTLFRYYEPIATSSNLERRAWLWLRQLARAPLDWSICVPSRSQLIVEQLKSLNKGCTSLLARCLSEATKAEMLASKLIPAALLDVPRNRYWRDWPNIDNLVLNTPVFLPAGGAQNVQVHAVSAVFRFMQNGVDVGPAQLGVEEVDDLVLEEVLDQQNQRANVNNAAPQQNPPQAQQQGGGGLFGGQRGQGAPGGNAQLGNAQV